MAEIAVFFKGSAWNYLLQVIPVSSVFFRDYLPYALFMGLSLYLVFIGKNAAERVERSRFGVWSAAGTALLFLYWASVPSCTLIFRTYFNLNYSWNSIRTGNSFFIHLTGEKKTR